jgi:hypothetical protein
MKPWGVAVVLMIVACARETPPPVLDLYDVKDLTVPIRSPPGCNGLCDCERDEHGFPVIEEPDLAFEGDDLAGLIRDVIDPEIWSEGPGHRVEYREGGVLIVVAPEPTHARIRTLLAAMRKAVARPSED